MSRSVSTAFWQAVTQERTNAVFLMLLTIDHPDLSSPLCLVNNTVAITSRATVYQPFNFAVQLEEEKDDGVVGEAKLNIEAVDQVIIQAIRGIDTAPTVLLELIIAADPDTVEVGPFSYDVIEVNYNAQSLSMTLQFQDVMDDEFPALAFTPQFTPGLF